MRDWSHGNREGRSGAGFSSWFLGAGPDTRLSREAICIAQTRSEHRSGEGSGRHVHGTLKDLTSKEIVILNEENQIVLIRRTRKTHFRRDDREIKASDIGLDAVVTIEATQDIDLKPLALTVTADSARKATSEK